MLTCATGPRRGMSAAIVRLACLAGATLAVVAAADPARGQASSDGSALFALPALRVIDTAYIDRTANACVDFFQFANGRWMAGDTIPAAYSVSGVPIDMRNRNELVVRSVLEDAAARRQSLPASNTEHKLGTYYATCMDSAAAETHGVAPIAPTLAGIEHLSARAGLMPEIATLQMMGVNALFRYTPTPDLHQPGVYLAWVTQGGLGLPDRDYYTRQDTAAESIRRQYASHVARVLVLAGEKDDAARADADRVLRLETALADASLTLLALREPSATDHPMSTAAFTTLAGAVDWPVYARAIGLTAPLTRLNVAEPAYFARVDSLLRAAPLADWRAYLRYHVLELSAPWLSTPFVQEDFAFQRIFTGARETLPRWKRCERATDAQLGEALGDAYVRKAFSPDARARARAIIDNIRSAFRARVLQLSWMSDSTKARALAKLDHVHEKVGYPDHWRDYTRLAITDAPFISNVVAANRFEWERVVARPGTVVDTTEWRFTVPTVNAYYDATKNEMAFPAGALVPQTFDPAADAAANYGSLGASWAGHELTHGFDDQGRHYDADGSLRDWWAPADSAQFTRQAALLMHQFDGYIQVDTFHVNGHLTLGENIADYGGLLTGVRRPRAGARP